MKKYILLFIVLSSSLVLGQVPTRPVPPTPVRGTPIPTRPVPVTPFPTVVPTVISTATPIPPITPTPSPNTKIVLTVPDGVVKVDSNNKLVWADNSLVYVQLCDQKSSNCYVLTLVK